jgi:molecular chaperone GrpE
MGEQSNEEQADGGADALAARQALGDDQSAPLDEWSVAAQALIDEAKLAVGEQPDGELSVEQRIAQLEKLLAERTDDLQRLQAEYINYKRRVDRDRAVSKQHGVNSVVKELVPIVDAVAAAAEHEEMTAGFKAVAAEIDKLAVKLGLTSFAALGDEFDPNLHEALLQIPTADYPPMTIAQVIQRGYKLGEVTLRPARVAVAVTADE